MLTVGELKKMLAVKRDTDIVCINEMVIDFARFNNDHGVDKAIDLEVFARDELSNDGVRKTRLRAAGVNVL